MCVCVCVCLDYKFQPMKRQVYTIYMYETILCFDLELYYTDETSSSSSSLLLLLLLGVKKLKAGAVEAGVIYVRQKL
jgi:hypothetical protein